MVDKKKPGHAREITIEELLERGGPKVTKYFSGAEDALEGARLLRTIRQQAGLSQAELAQKLKVKPARISMLEKGGGLQGPTFALLKRVARACGFDFDLSQAMIPLRDKASDVSHRFHRPLVDVKLGTNDPMVSDLRNVLMNIVRASQFEGQSPRLSKRGRFAVGATERNRPVYRPMSAFQSDLAEARDVDIFVRIERGGLGAKYAKDGEVNLIVEETSRGATESMPGVGTKSTT